MPGIGAWSAKAETPNSAEKTNADPSEKLTVRIREFILTTCLEKTFERLKNA